MQSDADTTSSSVALNSYRAPWWLPGGHLQTIYARALARNYAVPYRRERWQTPDRDFIDLDWLDAASADGAKLLILFHGLEGYSKSHYALSLMAMAARHGWRGVVPHFRGCSGEINRLKRSYHSGDSREIDWILRRLKHENPGSQLYTVGVSLGGNMLLKWLGEEGRAAGAVIERAVAVSTPLDLVAAANRLDRGLHRFIYTNYFLKYLRPKALAKVTAHDLPFDARALRASRTFRQFDDIFTAPIHGFKDAKDYWTRCSSKPWLKNISVPTLILNARNDPFLPESALPSADEVSNSVTLLFPRDGGHVGFVSGEFPGNLNWLADRVMHYFASLDTRGGVRVRA
ncbi:MAG TPA: hydrolase [Terriglobales bacterium]|jgi:predicted alpha/beta-fold hydrolase|nr:hydrolase [Terriglobales bacterium]